MNDTETLHVWLDALGAAKSPRWVITLRGKPHSKPRPRASGLTHRVYTDRAALAAERHDGYAIRKMIHGPLVGNVAMAALFYLPDRRTRDVDNLVKHIWDAANGVAVVDDSQITAMMCKAELDREAPRTVLAFAHCPSTLTR